MPETGWCCALTRPAAEEVAEKSIRQAGFRVYLPRYRKILRGVRLDETTGRRIRTRGAGEVVMRPLFGQYIFIELHPGQSEHGITIAVGVVKLLRHPAVGGLFGTPKLIDAEVIEEIRLAEQRGDFDQVRGAAPRLRRTDLAPGDQVSTAQGVGAELVGLDDAGRAQVMQTWFNAPRLVTVSDARELVAHG
jgi:hypothetical protein